ncbi:hypothetical protein [Aeromonas sp. QDB48]|uniref:hypothetical protein n=1 Tax=Aeromonas sp. QDB48 TaxID=2990492 RepID=UPI0022E2AC33|nr:hypothetical protein [Aeromonas sp. QDB48]
MGQVTCACNRIQHRAQLVGHIGPGLLQIIPTLLASVLLAEVAGLSCQLANAADQLQCARTHPARHITQTDIKVALGSRLG